MIERVLQWFRVAVPAPDAGSASVQVGCHFEEVLEMAESLGDEELRGSLLAAAAGYKARLDWCVDALANLRPQDRVALCDALCDKIVTAVGVGYMLGFDMQAAMAEVMRSNESKFEHGAAVFNGSGKIAKGRFYTPPDLGGCVGG